MFQTVNAIHRVANVQLSDESLESCVPVSFTYDKFPGEVSHVTLV